MEIVAPIKKNSTCRSVVVAAVRQGTGQIIERLSRQVQLGISPTKLFQPFQNIRNTFRSAVQQRNLLLLLRAVTQCVSPSVTLVVYSRFDSVLQCQPVDFLLLLRLHNQPAVIIITDHFVCEDERASRANSCCVCACVDFFCRRIGDR